ncbi:amidoligase family protein [Streptomyces sp. NBC_01433]|uniref:amidoligase family protein n=1 Tax=Streptomyces sp. NBC_01433 TaxID=2903864 RepID=UPI002259F238|nr:amidoligase family protein [Streptomyces sp. NBC_01433]MCX4682302.1 amidoligase family protein [Streptomyces sp. NBC_01433]
MGSGSRIDHQHHLVATTASNATITASDEEAHLQLISRALQLRERLDLLGLTPVEQEEYAQVRQRLQDEYGEVPAAFDENDDEDRDFPVQGESSRPDLTGLASQEAIDALRSAMNGNVPAQRGSSTEGHLGVDERAVQRAAAQQVLDEVAAEHQAATALQEQAREQWPADRPVNYTDDFDAFQRDFEAARDRAERGEQVIPYMTENATGGLGAREGGRGFGVEIEFDIQPGVDRRTALRNIGREMHEAGLARDSHQHGYHAQQQAGYTDAPNAWRLEDDCTVAGEIVSPILYDEPQTWNNLAQVCEIVERNGGRASFGTGGHVHVGMHDYDHDVANHTRLMQTYAQHEDVLYRLAQNPSSEGNRHRGTRWCRPNPVPSQGYTALSQVQSYHGMAVNLSGAMRGGQSAHGEFRLWDGSLSPSVIQTQVKLSLGLAAAAVRQDSAPAGSRMALGSHREQRSQAGVGQRRRLSGDDWRTNTADFRQMVDSLFQRPEDKAQATSLFQQTRWQGR